MLTLPNIFPTDLVWRDSAGSRRGRRAGPRGSQLGPAGKNTAAVSCDLPVQVACFGAGCAATRMRTTHKWTARKSAFRTVTAHAQNIQVNHRGLRNPLMEEVLYTGALVTVGSVTSQAKLCQGQGLERNASRR